MSCLHHPNVVSFYGVVRDGPGGSLATVTEFMVNGSLKQFLQKKDRYIFVSIVPISSKLSCELQTLDRNHEKLLISSIFC